MLGAGEIWINPLEDGIITGYFGKRKNPILDKEEFHNGLDIGAKEDSEVFCVKSGVVEKVGVSKTYGNYLEYKTNDG